MADNTKKTAYQKPELEHLGTVSALTAGGSSGEAENNNGNGQRDRRA